MIINRIKEQIGRKLIAYKPVLGRVNPALDRYLTYVSTLRMVMRTKRIIRVVLVDLSAAYNTVNHNLLLKKYTSVQMSGT